MSRRTYSVHLSRTVRACGREVVLDARASIRVSSPQGPEEFLETLRAQCRDELDEMERRIVLERSIESHDPPFGAR